MGATFFSRVKIIFFRSVRVFGPIRPRNFVIVPVFLIIIGTWAYYFWEASSSDSGIFILYCGEEEIMGYFVCDPYGDVVDHIDAIGNVFVPTIVLATFFGVPGILFFSIAAVYLMARAVMLILWFILANTEIEPDVMELAYMPPAWGIERNIDAILATAITIVLIWLMGRSRDDERARV